MPVTWKALVTGTDWGSWNMRWHPITTEKKSVQSLSVKLEILVSWKSLKTLQCLSKAWQEGGSVLISCYEGWCMECSRRDILKRDSLGGRPGVVGFWDPISSLHWIYEHWKLCTTCLGWTNGFFPPGKRYSGFHQKQYHLSSDSEISLPGFKSQHPHHLWHAGWVTPLVPQAFICKVETVLSPRGCRENWWENVCEALDTVSI